MKATRIAWAAAFAVVAAQAQQPAPQPPVFASADLSPAGIRAMADGCASCHGTDGHAVVLKDDDLGLAGMPRDRFVARMTAFKEGKRKATLMHQLAKGFSEAEIAALAEHFSKMPR